MLTAALGFAAMGTLVKTVTTEVPPVEIVFWRSVVSGLLVVPLAWSRSETLRPVNVAGHAVRGVVGAVSMFCYFTAISRLPYLGDAVLITYLSPLLVAALARRVLGERPPPGVWGALLVGLLGVGLVVGPHGALEPIGTLAASCSAVLAAVAYVSVSVLTRTDSTSAVLFWFSVTAATLTAPALLDGPTIPSPPRMVALLAVGVLATGAQWSMTRAYGAAEASSVSVFSYATPVLAYAFGLALLGEWPPLTSLAGAAVVVLAGLLAARARPRSGG